MPRTTRFVTPRTCPNAPTDDRGLPDLSFAFYDQMVIFDHIRKTILVVAQAHVGPGVDPKAAYESACGRVDELVDAIGHARARAGRPRHRHRLAGHAPAAVELHAREYEAVVRHCQEYIKAGDIFQVVPSQRFEVETQADPFDIYRVLRVVNPEPVPVLLAVRRLRA